MNIASLFASIGFKTDEAPLKRLSRSIEDMKQQLNSLKEAAERVKTIMELVVGVRTIERLYTMSETFAHWGQNVKILSETIGLSTDELQRLSYAAEQSGVSAEEMTHSLAHLSRHIYDAKNGSKEAAESFYKAGISMNQVAGFTNAQQALSVLADRIQATKDPMLRLGMAQALLGRGGYQMVAFLSKGSEAMKEQGKAASGLGLVLSEGQINNLDMVAKGFQRFHGFIHAVGADIASYFGPGLIFLIDKMLAFYNANRKLITSELHHWLDRVGYTMGFITKKAMELTIWILETSKAIGHLWASLNDTPWGGELPPWAQAIKDFFNSFGVGTKGGIKLADLFKGDNANVLGNVIDGILDKAREKAKGFVKAIFGGGNSEIITSLADALGEALSKSAILLGFATTLGLQIALGVVDGLEIGIRSRFPKLANFLLGEKELAGPPGTLQPSGKIPDSGFEATPGGQSIFAEMKGIWDRLTNSGAAPGAPKTGAAESDITQLVSFLSRTVGLSPAAIGGPAGQPGQAGVPGLAGTPSARLPDSAFAASAGAPINIHNEVKVTSSSASPKEIGDAVHHAAKTAIIDADRTNRQRADQDQRANMSGN